MQKYNKRYLRNNGNDHITPQYYHQK